MQQQLHKPADSEEFAEKSSPIRICLVTSFPPSRGDLNEYGFHLASALRDDPGVDLVLLADETQATEELQGFSVDRCWRFDSLFTSANLLKAIHKAQPDVVWFNMGFSTFARAPLAAFLSITGPAIARLCGFYTHVTLHTLFERINLADAGVTLPGVYRLAGRVATRVLLCANDVSVLLPSFRTELICNYGVDSARVHSRPHGIFSKAKTSRLIKGEAHEKVILAFGYWGTYKRLELLLECMSELKEYVPGVKLMIGGLNHPSTPGYLESLRAKYADQRNICFMGYVPEAELPELFRKASVLVLPYTSAAGTSGVVHQACEYGLPLVAAAVAEIKELAQEHGVAIEFYPAGDKKVLTDHLIRILTSETVRQEMAEQNLLAGSNMQISQVVDGYLNLFRSRTHKSHRVGFRSKHGPIHARLDQTVGDWLLQSGIEEGNGGVARYYLSDVKQNEPISTEITGYCASALILLHEQTGEMRYWDAALSKIRYLTRRAWDPSCGAMPFEYEREGQKYSYFFDEGIIVRGLLAVWRKCKTSDLLPKAVKCGESMAQDFFDGKQFSPVISLPDKTAEAYEAARWSRSPGCYQLKAALAWWELWDATRDGRFLKLYRQVLSLSLKSYISFLPGVDNDCSVMDRLHAYSYFLEGLLPVVTEPSCRDAMCIGIGNLSAYVKRIAPKFLRSDVVAQLLRIRIFADQAGVLPVNLAAARSEAALIHEFQSNDSDPRLKGGFWFGRKAGQMLPYMNPVSTVFCYQALDMWERYQAGEQLFNWIKLI